MTHPLNLDELAVVNKMHLTCSALNATGNLLLVGVDEAHIDTVAWDPCAQTSAGVDIDQMVMSCLGETNKEGKNIENLFIFFCHLLLFVCFAGEGGG